MVAAVVECRFWELGLYGVVPHVWEQDLFEPDRPRLIRADSKQMGKLLLLVIDLQALSLTFDCFLLDLPSDLMGDEPGPWDRLLLWTSGMGQDWILDLIFKARSRSSIPAINQRVLPRELWWQSGGFWGQGRWDAKTEGTTKLRQPRAFLRIWQEQKPQEQSQSSL